jgi:hypothetical protein
MRKSTLNLVSVLKNNLLEFPKITRSLQTKDPLFIEKLTAWIAKNEEILSTYTISEVAELSGLQSNIDSKVFR